jgi:glycosyltransferase involved in cell wall biosynthesis
MRRNVPPVLIMGDHLGYSAGVAHGVTTYFLQVLPALAAKGINLKACFLREPHPAADELREHGIEPTFLSARKWDPLVLMRVATIARQHRCRIVHACGLKATLAARIVSRKVHAGAIVHIHDFGYPGGLLSILHRAFARPSDLGVCVSQAVGEVAIRGYHVQPDRVRVVHNGIRLDQIRSVPRDSGVRIRDALGISHESNVIAMVARMYPDKGHRPMLEMMRLIAQRLSDVVLLLAGDGPELPACQALAKELGIQERVYFLGHRNDVPEILMASDLVVMPSPHEGLGYAAIEALAAGRAVVGFAVGGLPEVVDDGADGRLVKPGDQGAFVDAVVSLLHDRQRLREYGSHGIVAAEKFSLDTHVERLMQCYDEAADAASPHA